MAEEKKTKQRIKMRLYKHPVKHDGTITEFAPDGKSFTVQFDGPLPDTTFWKWSETLVLDKEPEHFPAAYVRGTHVEARDQMVQGTQLWEVL